MDASQLVRGRRSTSIASRIAACLIAVSIGGVPVRAQLSPGKLSAPHAQLDDSGSCLECHDRKQGVAPERCLACHKPLAERIHAARGLHARDDHHDCRSCHMEHAGREFELIDWGEQGRGSFRHERTGYVLEGAHASEGCRRCHRADHIADRDTLTGHGKDLRRTYLGLDTGCLACHEDTHRGRYEETACLSCHTMAAWAPADGFDHSTTAYPLIGRHADVTCAGCHRPEPGTTELRYQGTSFAACTDCHADEHRGQFEATCESCHSLYGWKPAEYDHSRSAFPLTGLHTRVECAGCHPAVVDPGTGAEYRQLSGVMHGSCLNCHEDAHAQRLGTDCVRCHTTAGWRSTDPAAFDHTQTRYPLEGKHLAVECTSCHPADQPLTVVGFERCDTCHEDTHAGQFAARDDGGACESCHRVDGFRPALFGLAEHQQSRFRLEGAHGATPCDACHRPSDGAVARFRFERIGCVDCHADPHQQSVDRFMGPDGCASCHTLVGWLQIEFDHDATGTVLERAHVEATCGGCHRTDEADVASIRWRGVVDRCQDCHEDPHMKQFDRSVEAADCRRCHTAESTWRQLVFDHDRDSRYSLEGAHTRVACSACHLREKIEGSPAVRYRPLSTECRDCHQGEVPR